MAPPHLAQELKDTIIEHLPLRSTRNFVLSFRSKFSPEQKSNKIWSELLKEDNKWIPKLLKHGLRPILVGHDLNDIDRGPHKLLYITLVIGDWFGEFTEPELLLDSLRSKDFNDNSNEVFFRDSNIILNIDDPIRWDFNNVTCVNPRNIFAKESISTTVLIWGDPILHQISHKAVVGIGIVGKSNFESVDTICAVEIVYNETKRWSQIFKNPVPLSGFRAKKKDPKNKRLHPGWKGYADKSYYLIK